MALFNPRSSNFEPIEPLPKNPITGEPELTKPFDPELLAKAKRDVRNAPIDIAEGAVTAPVTAAGDIVDLGSMLPDPTPEQSLLSPTYAAIEETFDILSRAGISRDNAVKLINENTPINLEDNVGEFVGEAVGVTATGVAKAATGLAKIASKYGDEAGKYLNEIGAELGDMFRAATPGGDDFDGMAPATVSTGTTIKTSADFERPSIFRIFGGPQGRTADTRIKKAQEAERINSDPEYVFKESSIFRGEDKKIRYEIATKDVELLPYFKKQGKVDWHPEFIDDKGNVIQEQMYRVFEDPSMKKEIVLADVLKFDELFKEYPYLKSMKIRRLGEEAAEDGTRAMYDPFEEAIYITDLEEEQFISTLLHEIQHAVDHLEGRQYGASPTMFRTEAMDKASSKLDQLKSERNNFFHFITNKETSENFEKFTPDELDKLRSDQFQLLMSQVYTDKYINDEAFDFFRKTFDPIIAKFADWEKRNFQKLVQLRNEYDILEKQSNIDEKEAFRKYRSAGGEVDARNVQIRRSKPETQLNVLPSKTADMPKDLDLIDKYGKPVSLPEKSPLRVLFDELPETERAMLPPQPDANRLYGYHGTAGARGTDEPFFDINFARTNDQFLGEGFYFTLDPEIASEYASLRSIGRNFEKTIKGDAARKILTAPNVQKQFVGGLGKDVSVHVTPGGDYVTVGSIMKGKNIYGEDIAQGQYVSRFDLSNLKKPYVVRTEKQRKELKNKIPELKEQGYDSILFADFKDRSKQIMVFPEHMDKIDTSAIAGRSANVATETSKEMISVFPKPERMFPEGDRPRGGDYLNPQTGEVLSGRNVSSANIRINPDGKPSFKVSNDDVETVGSTGKGKSNIKVNLFKKKAGWKWDDAPTNYQNIETLVSVEHKGKHYYTVETDFTSGVNLKKYPDSKTEPRLRPTLVGSIELGEPVGTISVRGKQHPVYSQIKTFNKGGVVPMKEQMEMFEDGGLMDEGGTVDPVSGNDVPPGSTQEEVRDDIPAQLSEGEFVFPADVVRYWGLDTLMRMRQQAKMGLRMMEEMGQMGNSEEATIPDDIPFDINDLDMEDELEYNVGGFVPANQQQQEMGISGYQAAPMPTTSFATQPVQAASQQFVQPVSRPAQAYVPVQTTPTPLPTFGQITGPGVPEVDFEFATFRNEAGQEIQLRIKKGSRGELLPGEVLPEGYSWVDPTATKTEEVTTTPTTPQTTRVTETGDDDRDDGLGPGGGRVGMGGFSDGTGRRQNATVMGVSFDMGEDFIGGTMGVGATAFGLATGKGIPKDATATFTYDNATYTVSGDEYNDLKKSGYTGELADKIVASLKTESGINRNTVEYNPSTGTFRNKKSGEIFRDRDDDNDGIGDILNKAGQSIYSKVNKDDLLGSAQKMNDSQKAIASAYNDAQFEAFDFDNGNDDSGGSSGGGSSRTDWSASEQSSFDATRDEIGLASGGLASKPKPKKTKKMKRGGLASKK
jgi:hypothetical protein